MRSEKQERHCLKINKTSNLKSIQLIVLAILLVKISKFYSHCF